MIEFSPRWGSDLSLWCGDPWIKLSPNCIDELGQDLPDFEAPWFAGRAPTIDGRAIREVADRIRQAVQSNGGLAIVVGDGLVNFSDGQLASLHYGVATLLGRPVGQNDVGELLVEVCRMTKREVNSSRGYLNNEAMLLHTDVSDIVGLSCLAQADEGGASLFASSRAIHDSLAKIAPDLLPEYYGDWDWNVGVLGFPLVEAPLRSPIFNVHRGRLYCRYGSSLLRNGAQAAGGDLTQRQLDALDAFEEVAAQDETVLRYRLKRGEAVWMNNHTLLHGRESFVEWRTNGTMRRLLRAWTRSTDRINFSARFRHFDDLLLRGLGS